MSFVARWMAAAVIATMLPAAAAQAPGPMTPPPERKITRRIPIGPATEPPPIPAEEIVQKFVAKEDRYAEAFRTYTYNLTVRIVATGADSDASGEARLTTQIYSKADGERVGRLLGEPESTLKAFDFNRTDLLEFTSLPQFVLTSDQLFKYDITYVGKQKVDEIDAYAFHIKPKSVDRRERRFEGVVWVDDRDFEIIKTYGRFLTDVVSQEPFQLFESYRELVGDLRLPTYIRSDGEKKAGDAMIPLRLTLRFSDYTPPTKN
jgi:hypothetical protein